MVSKETMGRQFTVLHQAPSGMDVTADPRNANIVVDYFTGDEPHTSAYSHSAKIPMKGTGGLDTRLVKKHSRGLSLWSVAKRTTISGGYSDRDLPKDREFVN